MICDDCGATVDESRAFGTPAGWVYPCGSCACRMIVVPLTEVEQLDEVGADPSGPTVKKTTVRSMKRDR
jgi:hypothetical protein